MNLVELQNKIHQQNRELGWWDEERPFSTFVCLFHSELSEAMEGDRKGLMDDHLPQYPMFQVELADFVIRCLDWLGYMDLKGFKKTKEYELGASESWDRIKTIAVLHTEVSDAFNAHENTYLDMHSSLAMDHIHDAVELSFSYASLEGFDLHQIILEKVEYNKHRADHKRENRAKDGGKKY